MPHGFHVAADMQPVFIVGMNGSGTTMLLDHLDMHPSLYGFPLETKILPHYLGRLSPRIDLSDDQRFFELFSEIGEAYPFLIANNGSPVQPPAAWRKIPRTPAAIFDWIMSDFAAREGKKRWCEKSPVHVQHIKLLSQAFPDAQFIHVIRDGRDCAASFHRRWRYTPRSTIYRWKRSVREGRQQGAPLGDTRYLEVLFERLTKEPRDQLKGICDFLKVNFSEAVLHADRDSTRVKGLSELGFVENSGGYNSYFTAHQLADLERVAGKTLDTFGYSTSQADSDHDPPKLQRRYWLMKDRLRFATQLIVTKARSPRSFEWRAMASRIRRSLNHIRSERF